MSVRETACTIRQQHHTTRKVQVILAQIVGIVRSEEVEDIEGRRRQLEKAFPKIENPIECAVSAHDVNTSTRVRRRSTTAMPNPALVAIRSRAENPQLRQGPGI